MTDYPYLLREIFEPPIQTQITSAFLENFFKPVFCEDSTQEERQYSDGVGLVFKKKRK